MTLDMPASSIRTFQDHVMLATFSVCRRAKADNHHRSRNSSMVGFHTYIFNRSWVDTVVPVACQGSAVASLRELAAASCFYKHTTK